MAIDLDIKRHNEFLEVIASGAYDFNDAVGKFAHVLDVCRLTGLRKVLIDYCEVKGDASGTEKALYALSIIDQYNKYLKTGGSELKVAYLAPIVTNYEPAVEIGQQSELPFKLFDNHNEALDWLGVKKT